MKTYFVTPTTGRDHALMVSATREVQARSFLDAARVAGFTQLYGEHSPGCFRGQRAYRRLGGFAPLVVSLTDPRPPQVPIKAQISLFEVRWVAAACTDAVREMENEPEDFLLPSALFRTREEAVAYADNLLRVETEDVAEMDKEIASAVRQEEAKAQWTKAHPSSVGPHSAPAWSWQKRLEGIGFLVQIHERRLA